jgi:hypothetical protein
LGTEACVDPKGRDERERRCARSAGHPLPYYTLAAVANNRSLAVCAYAPWPAALLDGAPARFYDEDVLLRIGPVV